MPLVPARAHDHRADPNGAVPEAVLTFLLARDEAVTRIIRFARSGGRLILDLYDMAVVPRVLDHLARSDVAIARIDGRRSSLQSIYLELTGGGLRDP
jgi:hypothetical protein